MCIFTCINMGIRIRISCISTAKTGSRQEGLNLGVSAVAFFPPGLHFYNFSCPFTCVKIRLTKLNVYVLDNWLKTSRVTLTQHNRKGAK